MDTTIKVSKETHKILLDLRGYNGCVSHDDVILYLVKNLKEVENGK